MVFSRKPKDPKGTLVQQVEALTERDTSKGKPPDGSTAGGAYDPYPIPGGTS